MNQPINTTNWCDLCNEESDFEKSTKFSFVWISFITIGLCGIAWLILICKTCFDPETVSNVSHFHPTISSYMADHRNSINNYTFLLLTTTLISLNLLALHTEEFNARPLEGDMLWIYLIECTAFFSFSLVGIFHVKGHNITEEQREHKVSDANEPIRIRHDTELSNMSDNTDLTQDDKSVALLNNENKMYAQEHTRHLLSGINIRTSAWIHIICYAWFLIAITGTNTFYVIMLQMNGEKHTSCNGWNIFFLVLDAVNIILLILFGIFYYLSRKGHSDNNWREWRPRIRMWSFYIQIASGMGIVLLAMLSSLKRNKQLTFFCENEATL